jgi:hypothetical protein
MRIELGHAAPQSSLRDLVFDPRMNSQMNVPSGPAQSN